MAVPVIIAIAAISALAQAYQSAKARKANKEELAKIKAAWDELTPPNFDMSIMDPPELIKSRVDLPNFDMSKFTPEVYETVGKYAPQLAPLIREANPKLVESTAEGKEGRNAQMEALKRLKSQASGAVDPEFSAALDQAGERSQIESQSRSQSIMQDFARRGMSGAGNELAAKLSASQNAMSEGANSSRQAAVESYRQRLQALKDSASLGGQISDSDFSRQSQNAGIINSFNQRLAASQQGNANMNTGILNDASKSNWNNEQDIKNKNTSSNNEFNWKDKLYKNDLKDKLYNHNVDEQGRQNSYIINEANWKKGERDRGDDLEKAKYNAAMNKVNGVAGHAGQSIAMNTSNTQDTNNQIQGGANAATSAAMYYQNQDDEERRRKEKEKRGY